MLEKKNTSMSVLLEKGPAEGYFTGWIWRFIPCLVVVVVSILFFPVRSYLVPGDSVDNLLSALKLYNGEVFDFRLTLKGPIFPWLISVAYKIFGVSEFSGMIVVRLFYSLNIIMVYVLASKLFTRIVGMFASLFVVSSYLVKYGSVMLMYDTIFPFGIMLFIYLCILGLEKEKGYIFIIAGIWLGVVLTIRQDAILFFLLPWLAFLSHKKYFSRKIAMMNMQFSAAFFVPIILFILFLMSKGHSFSSFLGTITVKGLGVSDPSMNYFLSTLHTITHNGIKSFYGMLKLFVEYKSLHLLFIWIGVLVLFIIRRDKGSLILLLCMLLFLPLVIFSAGTFRLGRIVPVLDLTYIAMAVVVFYVTIFLTNIVTNIYLRLETNAGPLSVVRERLSGILGPRGKPVIIFTILIFVYGCNLITELKGNHSLKKHTHLFKQPTIITWICNPTEVFIAILEGGVGEREALAWMRENLPNGARLVTLGFGSYTKFKLRDKLFIPRTSKWGNLANDTKALEAYARKWDYLSVSFDQKGEGWWDYFDDKLWTKKVYDNGIMRVYKIAKEGIY